MAGTVPLGLGWGPSPAFRLLGPLEAVGPSGAVRVPAGRQQVILALLLLEANRVVATDAMVDAIWEMGPPDTARTQVQICVSRLRRTLTAAGIDAPILTRPPGYQLQVPRDAVDLHVFNDLLARARAVANDGDLAKAVGLIRTAVGLWRGPSLTGIPNEALQVRGLRLDEERLTALETCLQLELDLGRHHRLVAELGGLVDEHPLRERLRGQLMLSLYRSGRQAEALETYRNARSILVEEFGLEPGDSLRALRDAIFAGDPELTLDSRPFADVSASVELDAHLQADQDSVVAVTPSGPPLASAPPPAPGRAVHRPEVPHQLPADTADFVDTESVTRIVGDVLATRPTTGYPARVAVIFGRPGVGKSTVATRIGHLLGDEAFPDGQLFCDLRGTSNQTIAAEEVLSRFLRALGIPGPVIPDSLDERAEMYRSLLATRRVLIVLDNVADEAQIQPLLPGSGKCAVLVTSRVRLAALPGAERVELDGFTPDQALELLSRMLGAGRVDAERDAAVELVRIVSGLPLALRIVAARLAARPHWSLASMVGRLTNEQHRLDELAHGALTIRATLSLAYEAMSAADRRLLPLLSLAQSPTVPGWTAGALLDDRRPEPSDLLEPLVDVQMLDVLPSTGTGEVGYRFHDIIRLFAREQLAVLDEDAVRGPAEARLLGGWLGLAEQAHQRIYGGDFTILHGTAPRWRSPKAYADMLLADPLDWLNREQANLCGAVEQAAQAGLDELCWDLATTSVALFETRGYFDQWERSHERALDLTRSTENRRGTAALLASLGTLHISRSQPEKADRTLTEAHDLFEELGDGHGKALCQRDLALLARRRGEYQRALNLYRSALLGFEEADDIVGKSTALIQSSYVLMHAGDFEVAREHLEEALRICRSVGYLGGQARALRRVGQVLLQSGDHEGALRVLTKALDMVRAGGDVVGEAHLLRNLGEANIANGSVELARECLDGALAIREQTMDYGGAAIIRLDLARLLAGRGESAPAAELLAEAVAVFQHRGMIRELREAEQVL